MRHGFIAYARWLDSISWKRFFMLSLLAIIVTGILSDLPPFNLKLIPDRYEPRTPLPGSQSPHPSTSRKSGDEAAQHKYEISIDKNGVRIRPTQPAASAPGSSAPPEPSQGATPEAGVTIPLPDKAAADEIKQAIEEAQSEIESAIRETTPPQMRRIRGFSLGDHMVPFMVAMIFMSMIVKIMAAGRFKAEAQAVQATEIAESEALKRQVVEARMAAMQAQVEPHFLFNTLASIDHLIETDPQRASKMQKNLIALLRASMPTMREANAQGTRDLGRELAVIRPYLEILKVRMEERLNTEVRVSDGLLSADFPPMMLQGLVENAIKHGLEPKAEGGTLTVSAEIVHGKLAVTVADTGLGFGKGATAGTGIGLDNIRERLKLLYGAKASLTVAENPGGGTAVTITVPYATSARSAGEA